MPDKITSCKKCKNGVAHKAQKLQCSICSTIYQIECVSKEQFKKLKSTPWTCNGCLKNNSAKQSDSDSEDGDYSNMTVSLGMIFQEVRKQGNRLDMFKENIEKQNEQFGHLITNHAAQISGIEKLIDQINNTLKSNNSDINLLKQQNKKLETDLSKTKFYLSQTNIKLRDTEIYLKQAEQDILQNDVEIKGMPAEANENILDKVKKTIESIGMAYNEYMISDCFRIKPPKDNSHHGLIIVRFNKTSDKHEYLKRAKGKRQFNSTHIGYPETDATTLFVNHRLSPYYRKVFGIAKKAKNNMKIQFLWINSRGKILYRVKEGDDAQTLSTVEEAEVLCS